VSNKKIIGRLGEDLALDLLLRKGYKLVERNFEIEEGEIDLIMRFKNMTVFVEVRTRVNEDDSLPEDSIGTIKIRKVEEIAEYYIFKHNISAQCRIDAVCILLDSERKVLSIKHFQDISENYL
jgi:putative endonuclease